MQCTKYNSKSVYNVSGKAIDKFKPVLEDRGQNGRDQVALERLCVKL